MTNVTQQNKTVYPIWSMYALWRFCKPWSYIVSTNMGRVSLKPNLLQWDNFKRFKKASKLTFRMVFCWVDLFLDHFKNQNKGLIHYPRCSKHKNRIQIKKSFSNINCFCLDEISFRRDYNSCRIGVVVVVDVDVVRSFVPHLWELCDFVTFAILELHFWDLVQ